MNEFDRKHAEHEARQIYEAAAEAKQEAIYICDMCGESIFAGDTYYKICGNRYCYKCIYKCADIATNKKKKLKKRRYTL
ncbi:MAG: hypothetical protein LBQ27_00495 [Clostridiales bacterium]|jgi:peptide methionine sulfoxide reductase MsrB|nr:hypothetical protein [Clostridiales bacterium]